MHQRITHSIQHSIKHSINIKHSIKLCTNPRTLQTVHTGACREAPPAPEKIDTDRYLRLYLYIHMYALVCVQARACVCVHTKWNISTPTVEKMAKRINMIRKACDSGPSEDSSELMSKRSFSKRLKTRRMRSVFKTRICFTPGMSSGRMSSITHKKMMKASKRCHPSPQNSQPQYAVMLSTSSSMKITISTCQKLTRRRPHGFVKHLQRMHHRPARGVGRAGQRDCIRATTDRSGA